MTFRYVTLKDQFLIDAIKHKNRCEWYLLLGMYRHACGSFRKYDKWMKRHNENPIYIPVTRLGIMADMLIKTILQDE